MDIIDVMGVCIVMVQRALSNELFVVYVSR